MNTKKKYKLNKERFFMNLFILAFFVGMNIYFFYVLNNIEKFITTL